MQTPRPDIALVETMPEGFSRLSLQARLDPQGAVHLVEVGFTSDVHLHMCLQDKMAQHDVLCHNLQSYGWANVQAHVIGLGFMGLTIPGNASEIVTQLWTRACAWVSITGALILCFVLLPQPASNNLVPSSFASPAIGPLSLLSPPSTQPDAGQPTDSALSAVDSNLRRARDSSLPLTQSVQANFSLMDSPFHPMPQRDNCLCMP